MSERAGEFLRSLGITAAELLDLEQLDDRDADVAVFVSGSLLEGLGNKTSDIDLYAIGDIHPLGNTVISKKDFICIAKHTLAGRRVDVEFWRPAAVDELAKRLLAVVVERNLDAFECEEVDFMHRVKIGLPLCDAALFASWQQRFDYAKLVRYMKHQAAVNVRDVLEDLEGMLDNDDLEVALLRCHDLLGDACEYSLRCVGETNPKRKWGIKLLAKYPDVPLARNVRAEYWKLQFPHGVRTGSDPDAIRDYVRTCMSFADNLLASTAEPIEFGVSSGD